jgi:hypothetical protein
MNFGAPGGPSERPPEDVPPGVSWGFQRRRRWLRNWEVIIDPEHEHCRRVFHLPEEQLHAFLQQLVLNDVPDFRVRHEQSTDANGT